MARTSFKKGAAPEPEVAPQTEALISTPAGTVAPYRDTDDAEGEVGSSDINVPSLNQVHGLGPLSELFDPGIFVFNGELPLNDGVSKDPKKPGDPIVIVPLRIQKKYRENTPWGSDQSTRIFSTLNEVTANGGHIDWKNNQKPPFSPMAIILVLLKMPDAMDAKFEDYFPYEFTPKDKKDKALAPLAGRWALALWRIKNSAYGRVAKPLFTALEMTELKTKGLHTSVWNLFSNREKLGNNLVYTPVFKRNGSSPEEFSTWAKQVQG